MVNTEKINELVNETRAYLETKIELAKINFAEQGSDNFAALLSSIIIGGVALLFLIFVSFFAAISLGMLWNSQALGFAAVAGFYLLIMLILLLFKKTLLHLPIQNKTIKKIFNNAKQDNHN